MIPIEKFIFMGCSGHYANGVGFGVGSGVGCGVGLGYIRVEKLWETTKKQTYRWIWSWKWRKLRSRLRSQKWCWFRLNKSLLKKNS